MSYKDINEKYKKIFEEGMEQKKLDEEVVFQTTKDAKKSALKEYKSKRKEIDKLLKLLQTKLKKHQEKFVMGKGPDWGYIGDLGKIAGDLEEIVYFINP